MDTERLDQEDADQGGVTPAHDDAQGRIRPTRLVIILAILAVFGVVLVAKIFSPPPGSTETSGSGTSLTSVHNDAAADYAAALKTGKPIYVLFHSLTCDPCVQISAVADAVLPAYADKVKFVNAITDDPSGQQLSSRFRFQYIPTSFFLTADGTVADSFTGVLTADEMRARLDSLLAAR